MGKEGAPHHFALKKTSKKEEKLRRKPMLVDGGEGEGRALKLLWVGICASQVYYSLRSGELIFRNCVLELKFLPNLKEIEPENAKLIYEREA